MHKKSKEKTCFDCCGYAAGRVLRQTDPENLAMLVQSKLIFFALLMRLAIHVSNTTKDPWSSDEGAVRAEQKSATCSTSKNTEAPLRLVRPFSP